MSTAITLRDYQEEALGKIDEAEERGVKRQLGVAATGLGKTIIFSTLAERRRVPTLILAHRDELISQAADKLLSVWPDAEIGVVKASRNEVDKPIVVASVQTLARRSRLEQLPQGHFGLVITDEAHHAKADSYQRIYDHLGCGTEDGPLHVGVTATPDRGDGKGLDDIYDEITFVYDLLWGIRAGYLSDLRGLRIYLKDVDFTKAKVRQGDYATGETGQMLEDADAPALIADAWLEHASDRKTIVFTPTVATAEQTRDEFLDRGIEAAMVSGTTPIEERRDMLKQFAAGELRVIANCGVLTEGFDDPAVDCIIMARPTKSRALYTQCIGRGSRKHPGKQDCLVMDVCGASDTMSLVTIPSLFGIEQRNKFEDASATVAEAMFAQEEEKVRRGEMEAKAIELFRKVLESPINWVVFDSDGRKTYSCSLGSKERGTVVIEHLGGDDDRQWHVYVRWDETNIPEGVTTKFVNGDGYRTLIRGVDLEMAQGIGEDHIRKNGVSVLTDRNAAWRNRPPTEKQINAARKWRVKVEPGMTAGDVSDAITEKAEASKHRNKDRRTPAWVKKKMAQERGQRASSGSTFDDPF